MSDAVRYAAPPLYLNLTLATTCYNNHLQLVAGIIPFAVHMANPILGPTESEFDLAYMQAKSVRSRVATRKDMCVSISSIFQCPF